MKRALTLFAVLTVLVSVLFISPHSVPRASVLSPLGDGAAQRPAGQATTLLPDGHVLLTGGEGPFGPTSTAALGSPESGEMVALDMGLQHPRAWHTATVLPDGTVLIFGGVGGDGRLVPNAELFNPDSQTFSAIALSVAPRALHTATLLLDGRVLIAGGLSEALVPSASIELWDSSTGIVNFLPAELDPPRFGQSATPLPNGTVLLQGGFDATGRALTHDELIDPENGSATTLPETLAQPVETGPPDVEASIPKDGASDVAVTSRIALRFSQPLVVRSVNRVTVTLLGPDGITAANVVPAEGGLLTFITPTAPLTPDARYTLVAAGPTDALALPLARTTIAFTTAGVPEAGSLSTSGVTPASTPVGVPEGEERPALPKGPAPPPTVWVPTAENLRGDWRIHLPPSPWQSLPALNAPPGVTALSGQVLRLDGWPLPNVTIEIGRRRTKTDKSGRFLLPKVDAGRRRVIIDGGSASTKAATFGFFMITLVIKPGRTTVLPQTIWMPVLDTQHAIALPSPTTTEVVATTPLIPGFEAHIPAHTVIRDVAGHSVTSLTITPLPLDRTPFPGPVGVDFPMLATLQPGGATVEGIDGTPGPGIRLIYPNQRTVAGLLTKFWTYDAGGKGWFVYGPGHVSGDGRRVVPDPGVGIHVLMCSSYPTTNEPASGPPPGNCTKDGEPVDLATGLLVIDATDLFVPDVIPISLTRTYRPNDRQVHEFGIGTSSNWETNLYTQPESGGVLPISYLDLLLPDGGHLTYNSVDYSGAVWYHQAQSRAFQCSTCTVGTPTRYYGSHIQLTPAFDLNSTAGWDIFFVDGTVRRVGGFTPNATVQTQGFIRDRFGNTVTQSIRSSQIQTIRSPNGRWIELHYNLQGFIGVAKDSLGRQASYCYDSNNRLTQVTDANGGITTYTYYPPSTSDLNQMTQIQYVDDARRNQDCGFTPTSCGTTPPACSLPHTMATTYYPSGAPNGQADLVQTQTLNDGTTNAVYTFAYVMSGPFSTQTDVTDPENKQRRVLFNSWGYTTSDTRARTTADERTVTYGRSWMSGTNQISSITEPLYGSTSRTTSLDYWATGLVKTITRHTPNLATDSVTSFAYEPTYNQLQSMTQSISSGVNQVVSFGYDTNHNLTTIYDPANSANQTILGYNAGGQVTSMRDANNKQTLFGYLSGDLVSITDPTNETTKRVLDAGGRLRQVTNPLGGATQYDYDNMSRLRHVIDPLGGVTEFRYDPNGNLTKVIDPRQQSTGKSTQYVYDRRDRLIQRTDALNRSESFGYDRFGNLTSFSDRRNQVTTFGYDNLNRRKFVGFGTVGAPPSLTYDSTINASYDLGNRLIQLTDSLAGGSITRGYDDLGNLICESTVSGCACTSPTSPSCAGGTHGVVSSTYDLAGRRTRRGAGGQAPVNYCYDAANRLTSMIPGTSTCSTANCSTPTTAYVTICYDPGGRRTTLLNQDGSSTTSGVKMTYGYDDDSRVSSIQYNKVSAATLLGALTYMYDTAGSRTLQGGTWGRTGLPAALDLAEYNDANQLARWGSGMAPGTIMYDANGNLLTDGTYNYAWNKRNQLASINTSPASSFNYDALGRRIQKNIGGAVTGFTYDGLNPVQEVSATNIVTANLLTSPRIDGYFARTDASGRATLLPDALGSIAATTDSNAAEQTRYTYEPFGKATATLISGTSLSSNSFQFTGRENDLPSLYYYRARYYSPTWQRFISEDPLNVAAGDVNFYAYAGNVPTGFVDPFGLTQCDINSALDFLIPSGPWLPRMSVPPSVATADLGFDSEGKKFLGNTKGSDVTLDCRFLLPLDTARLDQLLNTILHESIHRWYDGNGLAGDVNNDDPKGVGFPYDYANHVTPDFLPSFLGWRDKVCGARPEKVKWSWYSKTCGG